MAVYILTQGIFGLGDIVKCALWNSQSPPQLEDAPSLGDPRLKMMFELEGEMLPEKALGRFMIYQQDFGFNTILLFNNEDKLLALKYLDNQNNLNNAKISLVYVNITYKEDSNQDPVDIELIYLQHIQDALRDGITKYHNNLTQYIFTTKDFREKVTTFNQNLGLTYTKEEDSVVESNDTNSLMFSNENLISSYNTWKRFHRYIYFYEGFQEISNELENLGYSPLDIPTLIQNTRLHFDEFSGIWLSSILVQDNKTFLLISNSGSNPVSYSYVIEGYSLTPDTYLIKYFDQILFYQGNTLVLIRPIAEIETYQPVTYYRLGLVLENRIVEGSNLEIIPDYLTNVYPSYYSDLTMITLSLEDYSPINILDGLRGDIKKVSSLMTPYFYFSEDNRYKDIVDSYYQSLKRYVSYKKTYIDYGACIYDSDLNIVYLKNPTYKSELLRVKYPNGKKVKWVDNLDVHFIDGTVGNIFSNSYQPYNYLDKKRNCKLIFDTTNGGFRLT